MHAVPEGIIVSCPCAQVRRVEHEKQLAAEAVALDPSVGKRIVRARNNYTRRVKREVHSEKTAAAKTLVPLLSLDDVAHDLSNLWNQPSKQAQ